MKNKMNKILAVLLAMTLLALAVVVGTLAFLVDTDNEVKNVFVVGANVDIALTETKGSVNTNGEHEFPIVIGAKAAKDPVITVGGTSDSCWVFVGVKEGTGVALKGEATAEDWVTYTMFSDWTATGVTTTDGYVIYKRAAVSEKGASLQVLAGYTVMDGENEAAEQPYKTGYVEFENRSEMPANNLTLDFKAYAIQADGFDTADAAWTALYAQMNPANP